MSLFFLLTNVNKTDFSYLCSRKIQLCNYSYKQVVNLTIRLSIIKYIPHIDTQTHTRKNIFDFANIYVKLLKTILFKEIFSIKYFLR